MRLQCARSYGNGDPLAATTGERESCMNTLDNSERLAGIAAEPAAAGR